MHWLATGERKDAPIWPNNCRAARALRADAGALRHVTGVNLARKHLGWYTKGLHGSAEFRNRVNFFDDPDMVKAALEEFYMPLIEQATSRRRPHKRGRSREGPIIAS
jgi:tRNA-dihydrouridine synthase B